MPRPAVTAENFWNRVRKGNDDQCWQWMGYRSKSSSKASIGYGRVDAFGLKGVYVHRLAYIFSNGGGLEPRKLGDLLVRHTCDNPICCNPKHLVLGTHADNMRDKIERGRQHSFRSFESPNAKLNPSDVRAIRELSKKDWTRRELAVKFGVSIQTIKAVRSGRHYADVT
jgi:HNH endonuclease